MFGKNLHSTLQNFSKKKVLVIGDVMIDQYTYGNVTRISPEAPVPVVQKISDKFILGGASNVANNIASLGAKVTLIGAIGNDSGKEIMTNILAEKKIIPALFVSSSRTTTFKNRIMVNDFHQIIRIDEENLDNLNVQEEKKILKIIARELPKIDVIILSDYAKGLFSKFLTPRIIKLAKKYKKIVLADIKPKNKDFFIGVDIIAPNLREAQEISGEQDLVKAGKFLAKHFKASALITLGADGIMLFPKKGLPKKLNSRKVKVFDVSGAGDTVIAVLGLGIASNLKLQDAAEIANHAGAIVVQKPGTAILSVEELESDFNGITNHAEDVAKVSKLWGYEKWLENNDKYCCKLLVVNKGFQCSLHYHKEKDEMFYVSKGQVRLESDGKVSYMKEGNFARILPGTKHRFRGVEDSVIIEVSTHHDESDSHRIEESRKVG